MRAPAFIVSAIASGQGKTTATAALARHLMRAGLAVRVFKVGADFLGRNRRQRQPLEAVQPLDRVGEVRIGVDDLAGGRLKGEARLPQPPHP